MATALPHVQDVVRVVELVRLSVRVAVLMLVHLDVQLIVRDVQVVVVQAVRDVLGVAVRVAADAAVDVIQVVVEYVVLVVAADAHRFAEEVVRATVLAVVNRGVKPVLLVLVATGTVRQHAVQHVLAIAGAHVA